MRRSILHPAMTRSNRRLVAWLGILGIAFAQLAVTAHACVTRTMAMETFVAEAHALAHEGHCMGQQPGAAFTPHGNACEVQCTDGARSAGTPDLPPVAPVPLMVALAPVATIAKTGVRDSSVLAANSAAPPLALQFCRLLI
jgi:hypothetical protein